jgi:type IV pilus assembly protein PilN
VILINLLPHREEKRKRRKIAFFAGIGVSAGAGLAAVGLWYGVLEHLTSVQRDRNAFLTAEIKKLEVQIKDIASLKAEIDSLIARQKAVEDLQADRNLPVHLLNELVKQTPEGVYFATVKQDGRVLSVNGIAQTQERISEFLRNTANNSEWLVRPELVESKAANVVTANREQKRLFDFTMRLNVKRPQDTPAAAPTAPARAASAPVAKKA